MADGRGLKFDDVKSIANGKVWTGSRRFDMKLIDNVGDFQTAVSDTAKSVEIKGEPTLVRPDKDRKTLMDLLLGDVSQYLPSREKMLEQQGGLLLSLEVGWGFPSGMVMFLFGFFAVASRHFLDRSIRYRDLHETPEI